MRLRIGIDVGGTFTECFRAVCVERAAVAARRGFVVHVLFRQRPSQEVPR